MVYGPGSRRERTGVVTVHKTRVLGTSMLGEGAAWLQPKEILGTQVRARYNPGTSYEKFPKISCDDSV
jgi:hypothetical protein